MRVRLGILKQTVTFIDLKITTEAVFWGYGLPIRVVCNQGA